MSTGIVRSFNEVKGFGFIIPDEGGQDLFAHVSSINSRSGPKTLAKNQRVSFEITRNPKGDQAVNIRPAD